MAASYPTSVKSFTTKSDGVDLVQAAHVNDLQDEVTAIENDILTSGLTLTSGKIKFPATQIPSAGVNDFDDYEEGTFTPTIASSGGGTPTYGLQVGLYTKKGREVSFTARVQLATLGTLGAGTITISGLPFTSNNTSQSHAPCFVGFFTALTTAVVFMNGYITPASNAVVLNILTAAATGVTQLAKADLSGTSDIIVGGTYYV